MVAGVLGCAAVALACAADELERARQLRYDYQRCLELHPDDEAACDELRVLASEAFDAYEESAQDQWGCDDTPDGCDRRR